MKIGEEWRSDGCRAWMFERVVTGFAEARKGEPMIYSDGYFLTYFPKRNTIEIVMPQTITTLTNTVAMVSNRKTVLTGAEEAAILSVVKAIMERRTDE